MKPRPNITQVFRKSLLKTATKYPKMSKSVNELADFLGRYDTTGGVDHLAHCIAAYVDSQEWHIKEAEGDDGH